MKIKINYLNLISVLSITFIASFAVVIYLGSNPALCFGIGLLAPAIMRKLGFPIVEVENDES